MTIYYLNWGYDVDKFKEICQALEIKYKDLKKEELLVDIDDSLIQVYKQGRKEIIVSNSVELDLIKARTNIDLSDFAYTIAIVKNGEIIYK